MRQEIWKNCAKMPCHAKTNARQGIFLKREEKGREAVKYRASPKRSEDEAPLP